MSSEWKKTTLARVASSISETFDFTKKQNVVFINTSDVYEGKFLHKEYCDKNCLPGQAKKSIQPDDILLSEIRPANRRFAYVDFLSDDYVVSTKFMVIRATDDVLPKYLYLILTNNQTLNELQRIAEYRSGTFPQITFDSISHLQLILPPKQEQEEILKVTKVISDKIELNQQMSRNLEAIASAIFKSWFVDFDPVRAKMEGRQPVGIDAATASLVPDSFDDSPLGKIPKGWQIKPLDQIANFLNGLALQKYPPVGNEYLPVIKIAELRRGVTESSGRASSNIKTEYVVEDGDVLFSWSGSLEVCIWCGGKGALNQHLFKVTSADYPKWFYYQWVKYYLPNFQAIAASKATTMGHIQRHHLTETQVLVPPENTLQMMDKKMAYLLNRIVSNNLESRTLTTIRDTLLPKLMSGEIRIKDAEKLMEAVA